MRAISRVLELLEKISADAKPISIADKYPRRIVFPRLLLDLDWAERKLGRNLATKTVADLFTSLSFQVETLSPRSLAVTVPSWRATKDISIPEDLVEEIGRMLGYASINPTPPAVLISPPRTNSRREQSKHVRAVFISQGLTEVQNYSFIPDSALPVFGYDPSTLLEIANPIASDQRYLRPSLIPGMWKVVVENTRYFGEGRLFEIGKQYVRGLGGLISERTHLVAAIFGSETDGTNLLELKRVVHCMSPELVGFPAEGLLPYEHPERTATLKFGSVPVGRIFEIHPVLFERGRAAFVDIDLDQLRELPMAETVYQPLRRFPISSFDLSVIADARELVGVIDATIRNLAGDDLVSLQFLQVFVLPEDRKSLSFRLVIGSRSHTLTSEEVAAIRNRIVAGLQSEGYELRR